MNLSSAVSKNLFALILLSIASLLAYSNALRSEFLMDDIWMFREDRIAYVKTAVESVVFHKPLPENMNGYSINLSWRPLSQILPLANHLIFGNNVFGYHVVNLVLFIICVFMIFLFLQMLFRDFFISLTASLLFAAHPVNSLMVNYISAHIFSVQLLLMLTSCLTYLHYYKHGRIPSLIASLLGFYLATLCHEMALALPLFLTWLTVPLPDTNIKNMLRKLWPFYGLGLILTALWLIQTATTNEMFLHQDQLNIPFPLYLAGLGQLAAWYITKLLFLHDVLLMYVIPAEKISITYGWIVITATTAIFILSRSFWSKDRQIVWALGWFAIGLLPLSIGARFQPAYGITIEPHWFYLASIGIFFIAAKGLKIFTKYHRLLPMFLAAVIIGGYSFSTRQLNTVWADPVRYGEFFMDANPDFEKARLFLADAYFRKGLHKNAERLYLKGFENIPEKWMPFNNLGVIANVDGRYEEAAVHFKKALAVHPDDPGTLSNLAIAYTYTGRIEDAERLLQQAIQLNPWMPWPRVNLAVVYEKQGRINEAVELLKENLKISPEDRQTILLLEKFQLKQIPASP